MRKIYFVLGSALLLCLFSACSNSDKQHEEDSIRRADSLAAIEAAEKAAEEARLDSIRQDSIEKAEKLIASIPTFKEIRDAVSTFDTAKQLNLFKSRGFTSNYKKHTYTVSEEEAGAEEPGTYTVNGPVTATLTIDGNEVCKYQELNNHGWGFKITINDAPQILEKMKKDADEYFRKDATAGGYFADDSYWKQYCRCRIKGDTFEYFIDQMGD
ncbi:MAG: hypothetical protein K2M31_09625 [Muribaculaceae bacterium]|nr:hypothetical protein [Muribaculaceae bacterium]